MARVQNNNNEDDINIESYLTNVSLDIVPEVTKDDFVTIIELTGGANVVVDDKTINENTEGEIQTFAVLNQQNTNDGIKQWLGSEQEYKSIPVKDTNTIYFTIREIFDYLITTDNYYLVTSDDFKLKARREINVGL